MKRSFKDLSHDQIDNMVDSAMSLNVWNLDDDHSNTLDISQMIEHHLTHMNSVNMKKTIEFVVEAIEHQSVVMALSVREFFESQLFR